MDDTELLRHSAHILLSQIGTEGLHRIRAARVLIVGLGGLGSVLALYLARSGVGHLTLVDDDRIAWSNLPRQVLYGSDDIGKTKVAIALTTLAAASESTLIGITERLSGARLEAEVAKADIVCDGSDNFATRFALNAACLRLHRPLVSAAVIRFEGQLLVIDPATPEAGCYQCLYPDLPEQAEACSQSGVLAPIAGVMGCLQATETLKLITGAGEPLNRDLLIFDGLTLTTHHIRRHRDTACSLCHPP